jgi:hypothetical protein
MNAAVAATVTVPGIVLVTLLNVLVAPSATNCSRSGGTISVEGVGERLCLPWCAPN